MRHRHLEYPSDTTPEQLGLAAIDDLLDRGDLADWAPLARAVAREPEGELANAIIRLCESHPMYGTSALWRAWIERLRAAQAPSPRDRSMTLADLRRRRGLTQTALARRLDMTQSDLSKLERRADVRLSTMRAYVEAIGATLRLTAVDAGLGTVEIDVPS